jgi:hypothetical protein
MVNLVETGVVTVTLADAEALPPAPVHVTLYVAFDVGETEIDPEVPFAVNPLPVQLVALVEDHVSVEDWPEVIEVGFALNATVGAGVDACVRKSSADQPEKPLS